MAAASATSSPAAMITPLRLPLGPRRGPGALTGQPAWRAGRRGRAAVPASSQPYRGGPVEFERVVPPSGNMQVAGRQFWAGPHRAGITITFWADTEVIHLMTAGSRIKSVRSHLTPHRPGQARR
jgi:hypothetical protein